MTRVVNQLDGRAKAKSASPLMRPLAILSIVLIGLFSFAALMVLIGYGDDLRQKETGQATPISRSAVGYAGLVQFLNDVDLDVSTDPKPYKDSYRERFKLRIYTPSSTFQTADIEALDETAPKLIILPKWGVIPLKDKPGWVGRARTDRLTRPMGLSQFLGKKGAGVYIGRVPEKDLLDGLQLRPHADGPRTYTDVAFGELQYFTDNRPVRKPTPTEETEVETDEDTEENTENETDDKTEEILEALEAFVPNDDAGDPVDYTILAATNDGQGVLIHLDGTQTYVLSDPDFVNNMGLNTQSRATLALELIETVMAHGELNARTIVFDLSLHGVGGKPNMIKLMTQPPFLAATLCLLAAAALIAWQGFTRFGDPIRLAPDYSQGPASLAKSSAAFFDSAGRLGTMGASYAELTRRDVIRKLGLSGQTSDIIERRLTARENLRNIKPTYQDLQHISQSQTGVEFTLAAQALANWKEEMLRE